MKKIILTAVAFLVFGFIYAQKAQFGAKVALNVATLTGDVENPSSYIGWQIGGFAEFKISEKFAIQPELMYSAQGGKESYNEEGFNADTTIKLGYINIPIMAKYYVAKSFSLEAGPQIGFLISAKGELEAGGESVEVDIKDDVESVDFGLNLGAGYDFTEKFSAGLRYNFGLSDISKDIDGESYDVKNGVFSLSVGYKF
ncbi:MAG TPA: porin family protein [Flavobacterium sp.]|jgi:opacity protein-like surface antigen|nr:porin family protein [Flavobacterium sp.]